MTTQGLRYITEILSDSIPYCFMEWVKPVTYPYFVGEYMESEPMNEDGESETTFILTGTTNGKWIELERVKEAVRKLFPVAGRTKLFADNTAIAVMYAEAKPIPTGTADLKRIEITLKIKEWSV